MSFCISDKVKLFSLWFLSHQTNASIVSHENSGRWHHRTWWPLPWDQSRHLIPSSPDTHTPLSFGDEDNRGINKIKYVYRNEIGIGLSGKLLSKILLQLCFESASIIRGKCPHLPTRFLENYRNEVCKSNAKSCVVWSSTHLSHSSLLKTWDVWRLPIISNTLSEKKTWFFCQSPIQCKRFLDTYMSANNSRAFIAFHYARDSTAVCLSASRGTLGLVTYK